MTAKEKAEELIHKYILNTPVGFHFDDAKRCALIAVDEMLDEAQYTDGYYDRYSYWEEVKEEI